VLRPSLARSDGGAWDPRPTELPEWMADAVTSLCALTDEDPIIRSSITKAVGEFRKSHEDMWEHVRMTWTEEQLRLVSESSGTQSYFS
jgi:proteasome activator subunit 4